MKSVDKTVDKNIDKKESYLEATYAAKRAITNGSNAYFMAELSFTIPNIVRGKYHWWIEYYYQNPFNKQKWDRFRVYGKINSKKYAAFKEWNAERLRQDIEVQLRKGKVPALYKKVPDDLLPPLDFQTDSQPQLNSVGTQNSQYNGVAPALRNLPGKGIKLFKTLEANAHEDSLGKSQETINSFALYINRLRKWYKEVLREDAIAEGRDYNESDVHDIDLVDFDQIKAQQFRDYLIQECELANASVNCTLDALKRFFKTSLQRNQVLVQPFEFVKRLPKARGTTYTPFTKDELEVITGHLRVTNHDLHFFANLIYTCYIRPKELCALKPADFNMETELVRVGHETSKGKHTSYRQLTAETIALIHKYRILSRPAGEPIFSKICGNDKVLRKRRTKVTVLWQKVIKDTLGIDNDMYALKHTGNIDYVLSLENVSAVNLAWLKNQNDHTDLGITQHYLAGLGVYTVPKTTLTHGKNFK